MSITEWQTTGLAWPPLTSRRSCRREGSPTRHRQRYEASVVGLLAGMAQPFHTQAAKTTSSSASSHQKAGFHVRAVEEGFSAPIEIRADVPDIILSDL